MKLDEVNSVEQLLELQKNFFDIIKRPLINNKMDSDIRTESMIQINESCSAHERLEFYAQQYWWRLLDSMEEDFPCLKLVLGDELFDRVVKKYLIDYPSKTFTLRDLGFSMVNFLEQNKNIVGQLYEISRDAAIYDISRIDVFYAADSDPITQEDITDDNFQAIKLKLQECTKVLDLDYPIDDLIKNQSYTSKNTSSNTLIDHKSELDHLSKVELERRRSLIFIYRNKGLSSMVLDECSYRILSLLKSGISLEGLSDQIEESDGPIINLLFQKLMALKLITKDKNV